MQRLLLQHQARPAVGLVRLPAGSSVLHQLHVEEALFRRRSAASFLLLHHSAPPAVVVGMSGRVERDVHVEQVVNAGVPVIRRFSGGGTVYVDQSTLFSSFISTAEFLKPYGVAVYPREVMRWMADHLYARAFARIEDTDLARARGEEEERGGFGLRDNDYVLGHRKCGGNAQRLSSSRWLQHTSFLWDYDEAKMETYLALPEKQPAYRQQRKHRDFVCRLKDHLPGLSPEALADRIRASMGQLGVHVIEIPLEDVAAVVKEARDAGQLYSHQVSPS